jgi:endoglucanase
VGIRNELRQPTSGLGDPDPWDWYTYYVHMTNAAATIHAANPDVLLFFTGWNYDTSLSALVDGQLLNGTANTTTAGKSALFVPSSFPYQEKIVLELHWYDFQHTEVNCSVFAAGLLGAGYNSVQGPSGGAKYHLPIVLTEWGFIQNGTYWFDTTYNDCLIQFMTEYKPSGWIQWELSGSFYIKSTGVPLVSVQDVDEGWGLLNHTWNGVRSPITVANSLDKMIGALKN